MIKRTFKSRLKSFRTIKFKKSKQSNKSSTPESKRPNLRLRRTSPLKYLSETCLLTSRKKIFTSSSEGMASSNLPKLSSIKKPVNPKGLPS